MRLFQLGVDAVRALKQVGILERSQSPSKGVLSEEAAPYWETKGPKSASLSRLKETAFPVEATASAKVLGSPASGSSKQAECGTN